MKNSIKYRCLIVDDEPIARKIINTYIGQLPHLECAAECKNAYEALEQIYNDPSIDIVFLDINMPNISGIAMVKILPRKLQIIFTTAYSEFAIESYELEAADYLLKPFLFERFAKAATKAIDRLKTPIIQEQPTAAPTMLLKSNGEHYPIVVNDILYCEAMKNYTKVFTSNGKTYIPLVALSKFEEELSLLSPHFLRTHRSFIVSKIHIQSMSATTVLVQNTRIPIGEQYKAYFWAAMGIKGY